MDPSLRHIPYQACSHALFEKLLALPYPLLLDSAGSERGRYDILCADPVRTLEIQRGRLVLDGALVPGAKPSSVFAAIRAMTPTWQVPGAARQLPFVGGVAGYVGYAATQTDRRSADYAIPDAQLGAYSWCIVVDHRSQLSHLVFTSGCDLQRANRLLDALQSGQPAVGPGFQLEQAFSADLDRGRYAAAFQRINDYILAGDCYQINLAVRFAARFSGDPWHAYRRISARQRAPYSAFLSGRNFALLCFSPERFLGVCDQLVETSPIKGTTVRHTDPQLDRQSAENLANSDKDRAENLMIVDLLRNDLGRVCAPGSIRVDRLWELQSFSNVHHLVSTVQGRLAADKDVFDLFEAAFPGGSITGAPKRRAMQIIDELEPHGRGVYCGSIVYWSVNGHCDSNIAIRSVLCDGEHVYCWGGGGIVADSNEDAEYRECLAKISHILALLAEAG